MMQFARKLRSRATVKGEATKGECSQATSKRKIFGDVSNRKSARIVKNDATSKLVTKPKKVEPTKSGIHSKGKEKPEQKSTITDRQRSLRSAIKEFSCVDALPEPMSKTQRDARQKTNRTTSNASITNTRRLASKTTNVTKPIKRGRSASKEISDTVPPRKKTRRSALFATGAVVEEENVLKKLAPVPATRMARKPIPRGNERKAKIAAIKPRVLCNDFVAETDYSMVCSPFDNTKYTFGIALHDEKHKGDVLMVADYVTDIFQRLTYAELEHQPSAYMSTQGHINPMMRSILVDWLVEVHMKFRLTPETLYLCVNIIDRYCCHADIDRKKLQLVGVTSLLIACKYEEIYPPEVRDCVYITDRAYTRQEVLDMEQDIVKNLKFKLTVPTGYPFLVRFLTIIDASDLIKYTANYYMERTLQHYIFVEYRQSIVAAAAVCLALNNSDARRDKVLGKVQESLPGVPAILLKYTGFTKAQIIEVAEKIVDCIGGEIITASSRELVAVKRKYSGKKLGVVAAFRNPEISDLI